MKLYTLISTLFIYSISNATEPPAMTPDYMIRHFDEACFQNGWVNSFGYRGENAAPGWLQWQAARHQIKTKRAEQKQQTAPVPVALATPAPIVVTTPVDPGKKLFRGKEVEAVAIVKPAVQPVFNGGRDFKILHKSRDQINTFNRMRFSSRKTRPLIVSCDFDDYNRLSVTLIIIPNNPSKEIVNAALKCARDFSTTYGTALHPGGRYGKGVRTTSEHGRGKSNICHLELFDGSDKRVVKRIRENPDEYAGIIAGSLGQVNNTLFIAPHEMRGQGGQTWDRQSERSFALQYLLPALQKIKDDTR